MLLFGINLPSCLLLSSTAWKTSQAPTTLSGGLWGMAGASLGAAGHKKQWGLGELWPLKVPSVSSAKPGKSLMGQAGWAAPEATRE